MADKLEAEAHRVVAALRENHPGPASPEVFVEAINWLFEHSGPHGIAEMVQRGKLPYELVLLWAQAGGARLTPEEAERARQGPRWLGTMSHQLKAENGYAIMGGQNVKVATMPRGADAVDGARRTGRRWVPQSAPLGEHPAMTATTGVGNEDE
jgi:hypothetical protein